MTIPKRKIICILGMHRSGTSMLTRILNIAGMGLGKKEDLIGIEKGNPTGHWENKAFVEINDKIISTFKKGSNWHKIPSYPTNWLKKPEISSLEKEAKTLIEKMNQEYKIWGWKDPRTCITLPFWQKIIGNDLVYVVTIRDPIDVAKSLKKIHSLPIEKSLLLWSRYYLSIMTCIKDSEYTYINSDKLLMGWETEIKKVLKHVQSPHLKINEQAKRKVNDFIKPSMWHFYTKAENKFFENSNNVYQNLLDYIYSSSKNIEALLSKKIIDLHHQFDIIENKAIYIHNKSKKINNNTQDYITQYSIKYLKIEKKLNREISELIPEIEEIKINTRYTKITYNKIINSKFFKLWQFYCYIRGNIYED